MGDRRDELGERIARIEKTLNELLERLRLIEELLSKGDDAYSLMLARAILSASSMPALKAARRLIEVERALRSKGLADDISRSIVELLLFKGPLNISELTRELRRYRGSASRRIVSSRLKKLVKEGIVRLAGKGRGKKYTIE